jgi:hypothetical protein
MRRISGLEIVVFQSTQQREKKVRKQKEQIFE